MAAVSRSVAALRVAGDDLRVAEVSRLIGREPSLAYEKDQTFEVRGRVHTRKSGLWLVRVPGSEPENLDAQIRALLESVSDSPDVWQLLHDRYRVDVFCGLFLGQGNEGFELDPSTLAALAHRNLTVGFDIYGPEQSEEGRDGEV